MGMDQYRFIRSKGKQVFPPAGRRSGADRASLLRGYLLALRLAVEDLEVEIAAEGSVTLKGRCPTRADAETAVLAAGNVLGVAEVRAELRMADAGEACACTYTVRRRDNLWNIAQRFYGDGARYTELVEANRPMIHDADEIYPGQVLRIPDAPGR